MMMDKQIKKNSFILYQDQRDIFESLPEKECKELILSIFDYQTVKDNELSPIVKIAFITFKNQLIRDDLKWQETREKRVKAGRIGGLNKSKQMLASASDDKQTVANQAVNVTVNDNVNVNEDVTVTPKENNRLNLSKYQLTAFLKEYPILTLDELKEQISKCNNYMNMSSSNYTNPGLFFKGWLKKFTSEKQKKIDGEKYMEESFNIPKISEEERLANIKKAQQIKNSFKIKGV